MDTIVSFDFSLKHIEPKTFHKFLSGFCVDMVCLVMYNRTMSARLGESYNLIVWKDESDGREEKSFD